MTTSNAILIANKDEALYIPLECLHVQDSTSYVFKRAGGKTVRQEVIPGLFNENHAEILEGLEESDRVYISMPTDTTGMQWTHLSASPQDQIAKK